GSVVSAQMGNGLVEHTNYNSRLQPVQIGLGTTSSDSSVMKLDYVYGSTNNNGNIQSETITAPTTRGTAAVYSQSYIYDGLNRLSMASEAASGGASGSRMQTYDCDQYGNRAVRNTSTLIPSPTLTPQSSSSTDFSEFDQTKNRLQFG